MPVDLSPQPPVLRRGLSCLGLCVGLAAATACGAPAAPATHAASPDGWARSLTAAVRAGDDAACRTLWRADIAGRVCSSLLATDRPDFGAEPAAAAGQFVVRWRVDPAEPSIVQLIPVTLQGGVATAIGGSGQTPLWAREAARREADGDLITYGGCAPELTDRLRRARDSVRAAELGELAAGWSGGLVVECPAGPDGFAAITGRGFADVAGIAASAWPLGTGDDKPVHLVLNPAPGVAGDDLDLVLRHEIVHVATRSYRWHSTWVTEGLADAIAADAAYRVASDAQLRADSAAHGVPAHLPTDAEFNVSDGLNLRYGYARLAVDVLRERVGWPRARVALGVWAGGDTRDVDGVSLDQLTAWWQEALR